MVVELNNGLTCPECLEVIHISRSNSKGVTAIDHPKNGCSRTRGGTSKYPGILWYRGDRFVLNTVEGGIPFIWIPTKTCDNCGHFYHTRFTDCRLRVRFSHHFKKECYSVITEPLAKYTVFVEWPQ